MIFKKIVLITAVSIGVLHINYLLFQNDFKVSDRYKEYLEVKTDENSPVSRRWMDFSLTTAKRLNLSPTHASRFYAYVATTYSDVLEKTGSASEASVATRDVINALYPVRKTETDEFFKSLGFENSLSKESADIVEKIIDRPAIDNSNLTWDKAVPEGTDKWYIRENKVDGGAMAGAWLPWILDKETDFTVPQPPNENSLYGKLESEKVNFAVSERNIEDIDAVYFWHGTRGFEKGASGDNITPAGVWLNIFYKEVGNIDDLKFAKDQKILSQSIADSFIVAWRVKYKYYTKRPSMLSENLNLAVGDPPFPSYVSGHSTISYTAATVLGSLYPEKKYLWERNAKDARNSRLLGGIHYNIDNLIGCLLGKQVGQKILEESSLSKAKGKLSVSNTYGITGAGEFALLKAAMTWSKVPKLISENISELRKPSVGVSFRDVSKESGILTDINSDYYPKPNPMTGGSAWADYDRDGDLDLYVASINPEEENKLYRNDGGNFTNIAPEAGVNYKGNSWGVAWADYDRDGDSDVYISNFGQNEDLDSPGEKNILYKNNGDGTFTDVTGISGTGGRGHSTGVAWADYDRDGDVDLYVSNYGVLLTGGLMKSEPNHLFRNNGNGTFTDVAKKLNVTDVDFGTGWHLGASPNNQLRSGLSYQPQWLDIDGDSNMDLFVATDFGSSPLFRNNGDGSFTDITESSGMNIYGTNMGVAAGDYDNDLDIDIFVTNIEDDYLWRNNGNKTFSQVAPDLKVADLGHGWATGLLDIDNDGDLELYVVNGAEGVNWRNPGRRIPKSRDSLYLMDSGKYVEVSKKAGISDTDIALGGSFADFDGNGFTDIFLNLTNGNNKLLKNSGNSNNWLTVRLQGTESNRDAIGAKIILTTSTGKQIREVSSGGSYLSQNSPWPTFGIGRDSSIQKIEVIWPSGKKDELTNITPGKIITITE